MTLPEIRQLKIFIALEATRSFTAAAKSCFITQSAVSHSLKSLETQLECQLIERMGKRIILTPYGEVFLHHAKRVIAELETSLSKLSKLKQWGYSSLHIAAPDSISQFVLPLALKDFYEKHPKCEVSVSIGDTSEVLELIKSGKVDLGFGIQTFPHDNRYIFTPLAEDTLCFITAPDHAWCEQVEIEHKQLSNVRLISYSAQSETKRIVTRHFNEHVIQHHQPLALGNMEAIKQMTMLGMGVGIIPKWVAKDEIATGRLVAHPISSTAPTRQWGIYSHSNKSFSLPEEDFIYIARNHLHTAIQAPS